jgi:hypothetical protein
MYTNFTSPKFKENLENNKWINDIFENIEEIKKNKKNKVKKNDVEITYYREKLLYCDKDFALLTKPNWDESNIDELDCLSIVSEKEIYSIREVGELKNAKYLEDIMNNSKDELKRIYPRVEKDQIVSYIHYFPSFWRLHLHFTHEKYMEKNKPEKKCYKLEGVIEELKNIEKFNEKTFKVIVGQKNNDYENLSTTSKEFLF